MEVTKTKVVVFDLDGTLTDLTTRKHMLENDPPNYDAFNKARMNDTPILPVVDLFRQYLERDGFHPVIVTGADETFMEEILEYLTMVAKIPTDRHGIDIWAREAGDHRPDHEVKQEWLNNFATHYPDAEIFCVFDDRDSVVKMWRDNGLLCLQVAPGDF